jgi:hypothetical protein
METALEKTKQGIMRKMKQTLPRLGGLFFSTLAGLLLAGCQSANQPPPVYQPQPKTPAATVPAPPATVAAPAPADPTKPQPIIRIKAGVSEPFKDSEGNIWLADQGFADGDTSDRPDLKIENTKNPSLYLTERYSMTSFTYPVRNGKYLVKLHFAETYEGITEPGQRVFSFNVQGHEFKDMDIWVKAGGPMRAYVESVPVEVTDGKVRITFTPNVENPQINAIEIIPQP